MPTIDADAHVLETPETWRYLADREERFRPMVVSYRSGGATHGIQGNVQEQFWVIDDRLLPMQFNVGFDTTAEAREMRDIAARLAHMDELEIDVQVLFPTLFLRPCTDKLEIELALARSYNRWLADIWKAGRGRLRWVAVPPLLSMDRVRDELAFARDNGACGIFMRGLECERRLSDPYFYPLYEIAQDLDLAVCLHSGNGSFTVHEFFRDDRSFMKFKLQVVGACHALLMAGTPAMFPKVRWGFIEVSSQWVPYMLNDVEKRFKMFGRPFSKSILADNRIYVGCETTDDLAYVVGCAGEDQLVIGTDYGHADQATEIEALRRLRGASGLSDRVIDKILRDNPARLYDLH